MLPQSVAFAQSQNLAVGHYASGFVQSRSASPYGNIIPNHCEFISVRTLSVSPPSAGRHALWLISTSFLPPYAATIYANGVKDNSPGLHPGYRMATAAQPCKGWGRFLPVPHRVAQPSSTRCRCRNRCRCVFTRVGSDYVLQPLQGA